MAVRLMYRGDGSYLSVRHRGRWVAIRGGTTVTYIDEAHLPYDASLTFGVGQERGTVEIAELTVRSREGGPPLTPAGLANLHFAALIDDALRQAATVSDHERPPRSLYQATARVPAGTRGPAPPVERRRPAPPGALAALRSRYALPRGEAQPMSDDRLERVATVYRDAMAKGEATTKAVARHCTVSGSLGTAGWLISRARERGHDLPPARGSGRRRA